jgi:hypothetical protein
VSQTIDNPSSSDAEESTVLAAHEQSRGDEQRDSDSQKDSNEDQYDKGEYQGDNESSNTDDETLVDADAVNIPDENPGEKSDEKSSG